MSLLVLFVLTGLPIVKLIIYHTSCILCICMVNEQNELDEITKIIMIIVF